MESIISVLSVPYQPLAMDKVDDFTSKENVHLETLLL